MRTTDMFPSKWLAAADLEEEGWTVTMRDIQSEELPDGTVKWVVYFDEPQKGLMLNKTNMKTIEKLYGPNTDDWLGKKVHLFPTEVNFKGEQVAAIRIRSRVPAAKKPEWNGTAAVKPMPPKEATRAARPKAAEVAPDEIPVDDIPF